MEMVLTLYLTFTCWNLSGFFEKDPLCESRIEKPNPVYVPRDETFEEIKQNTFAAGRLKALLHNLVPSIAASLSSSDIPFRCFSEVDSLYINGLVLKDDDQKEADRNPVNVMKEVFAVSQKLLKYDIPAIISSAWICISYCIVLNGLLELHPRFF